MRRGVIDIGTNSVKLLIADLRGDEISPHLETSRQTRLGRGLYSGGKLQAEPIQATVAAVNELLALAKANDCSDTRIIATSAVRDSSNPAELLDALGQAVDVLSGDSEARLVFAGVMGCPRLAKSAALVIDVGGGFPSAYPGMTPPPLERFFETIHRAFESLPVSYSAELWAEPGRALCAEYASVVVRVERRRGHELYINDGAYGTLFDAAHIGWKYPVQLLREPESDARDMDFAFWGPTCDDLDYMAGPFPLPADTNTGDYFEIGMLGAYGQAMRTSFNGFGTGDTVVVTDEPMLSVYAEDRLVAEQRAGNVVKL